MRVLTGSRLTESMVLATIAVVRDTLSDCRFSAWSRPKPAPDPPRGLSVASGVIPTKGGKNGPVPSTPGRASTGRWRSSPWKRCNHAPPRGRGQGAPRTARCIKTTPTHKGRRRRRLVREHPAPLGALRLLALEEVLVHDDVREHPAPLGALRLAGSSPAGGTHHTSGTTPHLCVTSSPPHGRTAVTGSKGLEQAGT